MVTNIEDRINAEEYRVTDWMSIVGLVETRAVMKGELWGLRFVWTIVCRGQIISYLRLAFIDHFYEFAAIPFQG